MLRAVNEHWHEVPELRATWLDVIERFSKAMGAEIERKRAPAGAARPDAASSPRRCVVDRASDYVAGLGVDPALLSERVIFETIVTIWERAIYG